MVYNFELFGKKLKKIRQNLKLNQKYISQVINIDDSTIRRIESRAFRQAKLEKIIINKCKEFLNVDL